MTPVLLPFLGSDDWILDESNRWNPLADVAELVDALVSGSSGVYFPLGIVLWGRGPPLFFYLPLH